MATTKEKAVRAAEHVAAVLAEHAKNDEQKAAKLAAERASAPTTPVMVRATAMGFYGGRRRKPGTVFPLTEGKHFHKSWMVIAEGEPQTPDPPAVAARAAHQALVDGPKTVTGEATGSLSVI